MLILSHSLVLLFLIRMLRILVEKKNVLDGFKRLCKGTLRRFGTCVS